MNKFYCRYNILQLTMSTFYISCIVKTTLGTYKLVEVGFITPNYISNELTFPHHFIQF